MKMATRYNFDEAYSMDSFTDSEWESICNHVGLKFASEEGKDGDKDIANINQSSKNEKMGKMKAKDEEKMDIQSTVETTETDVSELRKDMKSLRKTLKRGRVQLLNWNKDDAEIEETYKEFKNMSKMIKKKFKGLLYKEKSVEGGGRKKTKTFLWILTLLTTLEKLAHGSLYAQHSRDKLGTSVRPVTTLVEVLEKLMLTWSTITMQSHWNVETVHSVQKI